MVLLVAIVYAKHTQHEAVWYATKHTQHEAVWYAKHTQHEAVWYAKHTQHEAVWYAKHTQHVEHALSRYAPTGKFAINFL